jgi:hypothetical protein
MLDILRTSGWFSGDALRTLSRMRATLFGHIIAARGFLPAAVQRADPKVVKPLV